MLELAISMILLYLMLSAACSAIQEIIANMFRWRADTLERGIAGLLDKDFKEDLYKLPLISGLCSPNAVGKLTRKPSYIPSATFALAVLDLATQKGITLPGTPPSSPPAAVSGHPVAVNPNTVLLLQSLLLGTKDVADQKKRLEDWFDGSMDRISGWYKRKANLFLWIIGIAVCIAVNADSISLTKTFWNDPTLRAATVTAATEHIKNAPKEERTSTTTAKAASTTAPAGTANGQTASTNDKAFKRLNDVRQELTKLNIPLGWCWFDATGEKKCFPIPSSRVTFSFAGAPGNAAYDYWIVSNYDDGKSSLAGPFSANNAPDTLSDSNYVAITWPAVPGAKSYDILRPPDPKKLTGDCDCAVAKGVAGPTLKDKSKTLLRYKFASLTATEEESFPDPTITVTKPGQKTYKYWIVAKYKDRQGSPVGPFAATNAPDTLSDVNSIVISWQAVQAATGYDVLRTSDDKLPTGECNCVVPGNVTIPAPGSNGKSIVTVTDKFALLGSYKYGTLLRTEDAPPPDPRMMMSLSGDNLLWWFLKLLGLAATALAISQGAPFWFDLLQKAVNLRLAGDAPDEKKQKK